MGGRDGEESLRSQSLSETTLRPKSKTEPRLKSVQESRYGQTVPEISITHLKERIIFLSTYSNLIASHPSISTKGGRRAQGQKSSLRSGSAHTTVETYRVGLPNWFTSQSNCPLDPVQSCSLNTNEVKPSVERKRARLRRPNWQNKQM